MQPWTRKYEPNKIKEVVDNYEPDLIWFDFGLKRIPDKYKRKMAAYYYNKGFQFNL